MQKSTFFYQKTSEKPINPQSIQELYESEETQNALNKMDEIVSDVQVSQKSIDYILNFAMAYEPIETQSGCIDFLKN